MTSFLNFWYLCACSFYFSINSYKIWIFYWWLLSTASLLIYSANFITLKSFLKMLLAPSISDMPEKFSLLILRFALYLVLRLLAISLWNIVGLRQSVVILKIIEMIVLWSRISMILLHFLQSLLQEKQFISQFLALVKSFILA